MFLRHKDSISRRGRAGDGDGEKLKKIRVSPIVILFSAIHKLRRCSSVVEQGFHKAKVAGSIPAIGTDRDVK